MRAATRRTFVVRKNNHMTTLRFSSGDSIQHIQEVFRRHFSHLKIEFYRSPHEDAEGNVKRDQYLHQVTLGELTGQERDLELPLQPDMVTGDLEHWFEREHGLHVQVFRLQRGTWLQTTLSDALSLREQNEKGIQADIDILPESRTDVDLE